MIARNLSGVICCRFAADCVPHTAIDLELALRNFDCGPVVYPYNIWKTERLDLDVTSLRLKVSYAGCLVNASLKMWKFMIQPSIDIIVSLAAAPCTSA